MEMYFLLTINNRQKVDVADLHFEHGRAYNAWFAYGQDRRRPPAGRPARPPARLLPPFRWAARRFGVPRRTARAGPCSLKGAASPGPSEESPAPPRRGGPARGWPKKSGPAALFGGVWSEVPEGKGAVSPGRPGLNGAPRRRVLDPPPRLPCPTSPLPEWGGTAPKGGRPAAAVNPPGLGGVGVAARVLGLSRRGPGSSPSAALAGA